MIRAVSLGALLAVLAASCGACEQAIAETRSVLCHCTGLNVNATVCQGSLDDDFCTSFVDPTYCGSNGIIDCYVGGAEDGCIDRPTGRASGRLARLIHQMDSIELDGLQDKHSCAAAGLTFTTIDECVCLTEEGVASPR